MSEVMCSNIKLAKSYFGVVYKSKRGCGASEKHPYWDCQSAMEKLMPLLFLNARTEALLTIIKQMLKPASIV